MARRKTELEVVPEEELGEVLAENRVFSLEGTSFGGTEDADMCCGACKRVVMPGLSPEGVWAAMPKAEAFFLKRPGARFAFFFECSFCQALLRFWGPP